METIEYTDLHTEEMIGKFAGASSYRKIATVHARETTTEEYLETILADGVVETTRCVPTGQWIITNPDGEQYAITPENFHTRYIHVEKDIYKAKGLIKAFQNDTGKPITIMAPWGEPQYGDKGCFLAVTYDDKDLRNKNKYIIGEQEFYNTYVLED